jgi:hypothetical protein
MGGMEVHFGGEIGAYTAHSNFRRWEMLGVLPRNNIAGKCYDMQLVAIKLDQQRVRLYDPNNL